MENIEFIIVFVLGFISSFLANIAGGGGGTIAIPSLIFLGLSPQTAVATKRFASLASEVITTWQFARVKKIKWRVGLIIASFTFIATIIGANILIRLDQDWLSFLISFFIIIGIIFSLLKKEYGLQPVRKKNKMNYLGYGLYFIVDIIDTIVGAVGGFFTTIILISCFGLTYLEANATKKISGLTMTVVGTVMFSIYGIINYSWGASLLLGMLLGGFLGVKLVIKKGSHLVKISFLILGLLLALKLLF